MPPSTGHGVRFCSTDIAVAHHTTPFVSAYPWNPGFGAKYANPATLPANHGYNVEFTTEEEAAGLGMKSAFMASKLVAEEVI